MLGALSGPHHFASLLMPTKFTSIGCPGLHLTAQIPSWYTLNHSSQFWVTITQLAGHVSRLNVGEFQWLVAYREKLRFVRRRQRVSAAPVPWPSRKKGRKLSPPISMNKGLQLSRRMAQLKCVGLTCWILTRLRRWRRR